MIMPYPPPLRPAPPRRRTGLIVGLTVGAVAVLCGSCVILSVVTQGGKPTVSRTAAAPATTTQAVEVAATPASVSPAAPAVPKITDGTWTVGEDFPAGTYKTTGAGDRCYWAIYTSGKNQAFEAMIDNHLGGGNLRVTLKAGQDFESKRCGTWVKV